MIISLQLSPINNNYHRISGLFLTIQYGLSIVYLRITHFFKVLSECLRPVKRFCKICRKPQDSGKGDCNDLQQTKMKKFSNFRKDIKRWVTKRRRTNTGRELSGFPSRLIQRPIRHFAHKELKSVINRGTSGGRNEYEKDHHLGVHRVGSFYDCSGHARECSRLLLLQPASLSDRCGCRRCWDRRSYCNCSFLSLLWTFLLRCSPSTTRPLQRSPSSTTRLLQRSTCSTRLLRRPAIWLQGMDSWTL